VRIAIVGASGKTGTHLVRESLARGYEVVAVCRESSAARLGEFSSREGFEVVTGPIVSDESVLSRALVGCDAVAAILISVRQLRATELVDSLATAASTNGVNRLVFTAGEITAAPVPDERLTLRQRIMRKVLVPLLELSPYSVKDMIEASVKIAAQPDWQWTIVRAPSLRDAPSAGYRLGRIDEVTSKHVLPRADYAACMLDCLADPATERRTVAVIPADG
jgi:putative NADH-flavin reductase